MIWIIAFCYNTKTATRYFTGVIPTKTSVWNYLAPAGLGLQSKPLRWAGGRFSVVAFGKASQTKTTKND